MSEVQENRLSKLEDKMDIVKGDVIELKVSFKAHSEMMKEKMVLLEEHVSGDQKIINAIAPVLEKLPTIVEMAEEYQFEKKSEKVKEKKLTKVIKHLGIIATICGIIFGAMKANII